MKILIAIVILLAIALVAVYILGSRAQKKQALQQEQIDAMAQTVSMLIIDKKRLKIKESGLPQQVIDQTPRLLRLTTKFPIVKAKVGPKIMTLVAEEKVFDQLPVKREVKVVVSGIYITAIKSARGGIEQLPKKKEGFFKRMLNKAQNAASGK